MAKVSCSASYVEIASSAIQILGGIGFTWEHVAHLHLKRAKGSQLILGDDEQHTGRVAAGLGLAVV
jgi:alkylation response protein AidB-like acyl-CoA dehydrogenase